MKPIYCLLFITSTLLYSCADDSSSEDKTVTIDTAKSRQLIDTLTADKSILIYSYNTAYTDSNLVCRQWFLKDSLLKKQGAFHYSLPIESDYVYGYIISEAKGKATYETFDSLICETGGRSAWNKYLFTYDKTKRPVSVKHYKAWYENYDNEENPTTNSKPDYELAERIYFSYVANKTERIVKDEAGKVIEKIIRSVDSKSRVEFEEWSYGDENRFRVYYQYKDSLPATAVL